VTTDGPRVPAREVEESMAWEEGTVVQALLNDPKILDLLEYLVRPLSPDTTFDTH
jgi:hypothetical protein